MAEAGVAPGAVIDDAEGENLGANQEIPQQQAQGESCRQYRRCCEPSGSLLRNSGDQRHGRPYRKAYHRVAGVECKAYTERWPNVFWTLAHQTTQGYVALGTGLCSSQQSPYIQRADSGVIQSSYFYSSTGSGFPKEGGGRRQFRFQ